MKDKLTDIIKKIEKLSGATPVSGKDSYSIDDLLSLGVNKCNSACYTHGMILINKWDRKKYDEGIGYLLTALKNSNSSDIKKRSANLLLTYLTGYVMEDVVVPIELAEEKISERPIEKLSEWCEINKMIGYTSGLYKNKKPKLFNGNGGIFFLVGLNSAGDKIKKYYLEGKFKPKNPEIQSICKSLSRGKNSGESEK